MHMRIVGSIYASFKVLPDVKPCGPDIDIDVGSSGYPLGISERKVTWEIESSCSI